MSHSLEKYNATEIKALLADCKRKYPEHFNAYESFESTTFNGWVLSYPESIASYVTENGLTIYVFVDLTDNKPVASFDY